MSRLHVRGNLTEAVAQICFHKFEINYYTCVYHLISYRNSTVSRCLTPYALREKVSDAIFANEQGLKEGIVRTYPKLRGEEDEFEFGFNLKVYPDDPVEVATKGGPKSTGPSIGNWISTLLSPVDASKVPPPPIQD